MTTEPTPDPSQLDAATAVAAEAGELLAAIRLEAGDIPSDDKTALKALRDRADSRSQELIASRMVLAPGQAMLSEEAVDDERRLEARQVWIIDPLDGTWEYGQGRPDWAVHIALYDTATGHMLIGIVDLPAQDLVRTSADPDPELPALPTDRPIRVVASRTRPPADLDAIVDRLANRLDREVEVVNVGSVGAKVNEILLGRAEAYLHDTGFYEWDLAAPLAVAKHYGLVCDHWDGSEVVFNQMPPFVKNVFVSRPEIAAELRASLHG